jgi:hypothetical protein
MRRFVLVLLLGGCAADNAASRFLAAPTAEALASNAVLLDATGARGADEFLAALPARRGSIEAVQHFARTMLSDGSMLFARTGDDGRVDRLLRFPAEGLTGDVPSTQAYQAAWNARDVGARLALLEQSWAEDGHYADPTVSVSGRAGLSEAIERYLRTAGTTTIDQNTPVQVLPGGAFTFGWRISSTPPVDGFDVGMVEADRITWLCGFFSAR